MNREKLILDIAKNLKNLGENLSILISGTAVESKVSDSQQGVVEEKEVEQPTLEEVRAVLAEKNREGFREEVKSIIKKYGANKLTSLEKRHYADVLREVGELK